jgi:hypothetical protein
VYGVFTNQRNADGGFYLREATKGEITEINIANNLSSKELRGEAILGGILFYAGGILDVAPALRARISSTSALRSLEARELPPFSRNTHIGESANVELNARQSAGNRSSLLRDEAISRADLGPLLGKGGNKDVFAYGDSQAVGVLRAGKNPKILTTEIELLQELDRLGLPTVNASGPILVDNQPALVFDRFEQGSKSVVRLESGKVRVVGESPLLNDKSASDLRLIRQTIVTKNVKIDDLQFLIGRDGRIVISDPLAVKPGSPSRNNLQIIDKLIQQAEKNRK